MLQYHRHALNEARRSSVLNVKGAGIHSSAQVYTDEIIRQRSLEIEYSIDARQQKDPDEPPFG